jgi:hypothetical protein
VLDVEVPQLDANMLIRFYETIYWAHVGLFQMFLLFTVITQIEHVAI